MGVEGDLMSLPKDMREQVELSGAWRAWDVTAPQYGPRALALGDDGIVIFGITPGAILVTPWSDVEEFSFPTQFQVRLKFRDHYDPRLLTLKKVGHLREIASTVPALERERLALNEPTARPVPPTESAVLSTPSPSGGTQLAAHVNPAAALWRMLWIGLGLQVAGGLFLWSSIEDFGEEGVYSSSIEGWLLSAMGGSVVFVALVGFGTMLGIRAASTRA